ncbi:MAG: tail fiber domain-containing protein [Bacteroidetes bacterium]|nr:tail fiber domain-containing protein [Bacteroidota bacterium]
MKKSSLLVSLLCAASMSFAQEVRVNTLGNMALGALPNAKAKLLLSNLTAANDTTFGLYSTLENSVKNTKVCGAYFKNNLLETGALTGGNLYGVYLDNTAQRYANNLYGAYANNVSTGSQGEIYGFYANNVSNTSYGSAYGFRAINTSSSSNSGNLYGIHSTNNFNSVGFCSGYGAYLSVIGTAAETDIYGLYSIVSGSTAAKRYSGYFTGGKVFVNDDIYANLDVYARGMKLQSDERLKSDIKPLSTEKDKLYQLQGKSYKKAAIVFDLQDSLSIALRAEREPVKDIAEFGYLAQELQEIFPELVSMDSTTGYYAVNYIGLIPVIVEALKDQRKTMETQQQEMQQKIEALEKALSGCCANTNSLKSTNSNEFSATQKLYLSDNANAETMKLYQNAPNPFNERTTIKCYVPQHIKKVQLCVYTMKGIQVQCLSIEERGNVELQIEAGALSAGVYSYVLIGDGAASETKQMILTK